MKKMTSPLQAALEYASRGYSVIPICSNSKKPLIEWAKYQTERASTERIKKWWNQNPEANVGIVTGKISGIVAIDVDPRHGGNASEILEEAPTDLVAITGSGGSHLFYKYPANVERVPNRVGIDDGVDIRADGGYVVAAPSRHENGKSYRWKTYGKPRKIPPAILSAILGGGRTESQDNSQEKWLSSLFQGVTQGGRNDACTRMAGYFTSKGCPKDVTEQILIQWNEYNDPPLPERTISTVLNSVIKTHRRNGSNYGNQSISKSFTLIPFEEYMVTYSDQEVKWTIEDWLPDKTIAFMVAAPGSFKTWLLLDLAISVATGTDFLGLYPVEQTGSVLLIQQEDPLGGLAERMNAIIHSRFEIGAKANSKTITFNLPPYIPIFIHPDRNLRFDNQKIMDSLEEKIKEIRPKLVLIDPLYSAASSDDYMAKSVEHMWRLKKMRDEYGCSFIIAHHTSKRGLQKRREEPTTGREELWGSQFLNAFLETGWQIRCLENNSIIIRRHFKVSENKAPITLAFDIDTEGFQYTYRVQEVAGINILLADESCEIILGALDDGAKTHSEIQELTQISKSTLSRKLKALADEGLILRDREKRFQRLVPDES